MFEQVRNNLIKNTVLGDKIGGWNNETNYCDCPDKKYNDKKIRELPLHCQKWRKRKTDPCNVCTADAFCTKTDDVTNTTSHTLKTPYKHRTTRTTHKQVIFFLLQPYIAPPTPFNIFIPNILIRWMASPFTQSPGVQAASGCDGVRFQTCARSVQSTDMWLTSCGFQHPFISYYDASQFISATNKADLCRAKHLPLLGNRTEDGFTGFKEYCMISKSNTAIFCPELILRGKNKKVKKMNKMFLKVIYKKKKPQKHKKQKEKKV